MESRIGNSHGAEIPKRSRSLDLKSLYKSGDSKESSKNRSLKRKERSQEGDGEKRSDNNSKRKKSRKSLPLSSFRTVHDSNSSKSLTEVYSGGFSSSLHDPESLKKLGFSQKSKYGSSADDVSVSLGNNERIPKRNRRFEGQGKFEDAQVLKLAGRSNSKEVVNEEVKLTSEDSGTQNESLKFKQGKIIEDLKENRNSESSLIQHLKEEDGIAGYSAVNGGDSLVKKSRRKPRKRKDSIQGDKSVSNKAQSSVEACDVFQEDEENLEENAARMLSSRFNPSCTGFSSNGKVSASPSENGLSVLISFGQSASPGSKNLSGSESASVDTRILRPRKSHKGKATSRRRRHFYEIFSGDLDAQWVLNRRIKVFWPLDKNWYYGLVYGYDKEKKLHHVKYDDRDEEWIDLQNERIKLLLFPSELPYKYQRKRTQRDRGSDDRIKNVKLRKEKGKKKIITEDDSANGSHMVLSPSSLDENGCHCEGSLKGSKVKLFNATALSDRPVDSRRVEDSSLDSTSYPNRKHPIVYFRRRFRKTDKVSCQASRSNCIGSNVSEFITSLGCVDEFQDLGVLGACMGRLDPELELLFSDNAGQLRLNISLIHSKQFRFGLSFPVLSVSNNLFGTNNLWLVRTLLLLQCGMVMSVWPMVHMEILFVDNEVGLRFFLFEGSLIQAIAFVFQVLMVFYRPTEQGKCPDLLLPITSIRFKFSCFQDLRRQVVFAFYNFHEVRHSKWMLLDSKLKRHCLLNRQLPLFECTYDNIKALQNETDGLHGSPAFIDSSAEGLRRIKYRPGISLMGVSRETSFLEVGQFSGSSEEHRNLPQFALSFGAASTFFISLHLKLLMERSLACISFRDRDSFKQPGSSGNLLLDDRSSRKNCMNNNSRSSVEKNLKASLKDVATGAELTTLDLSACGNPLVHFRKQQCDNSEQLVLPSKSPIDGDKKNASCSSVLNGITVEIPPFDQYGKYGDSELPNTQQPTDLTWSMIGGIIPSPNPTAPRSTWYRNRSSSSIGYHAHGWSDGNADFFNSNFGNGPKKPRTQVSYSIPVGSLDYSSKNKGQQQRALPHNRIRRANEKRSSDVSTGSQRNLKLLSCDANVLITIGDRGWRVCGVQVVLELFDHNEWKLAVKESGSTRYSYKANQFWQPGSTNRFTHAMMWKGGKDWILEFTDRSQWALFKEMHEECYNRNVRAAAVKNIPIPGVRLIEEYDENAMEVTFVRCSSKYLRQVENDAEMALDPSRVLYDVDSDDEQWISGIRKSSESDIDSSLEFSDEMFEKFMDMFEKAAYTEQCTQFTSEEIQELMAGVGSLKVVTAIYGHWQQKRQRVGMSLIRHLQPPLWERYQQQVREWEQEMSKGNPKSIEKPHMFAFCMKPRGLELLNKGSKHRSQRRISVSGQSQHALGDHDGCHSFGSDRFDKNHLRKLQRTKSKKYGTFLSSNEAQMVDSYNQRLFGNRNGIHRWNRDFLDWPSQRHYLPDGFQRQGPEQWDNSDIDEFTLRDASSAAQHALKMANFKREKAQRLLFRADLAIHKAVVALMTAEAIKESSEDLNGDG
ncbi:Enhancer of polycomb-like transcription factor protein, putative isoform 3 [Hibiscus syriacus]|uniref:Enhancer of polycomb-like protein n=1 Tax=Hibiscus syriacus TaxID=106335 RepID=A0A6A2X1R2_HIBSY|nr:Enhancer of polycomb-like transcription factor protein, putative isoform 3 [Hibiscus syriacus]